MFGDCSDLDQKSMKKHSRSEVTTVVTWERESSFRSYHSGNLGTAFRSEITTVVTWELVFFEFPNHHSGDSGTDTYFVVFCPTGTQSWLGAILLSFDLVYKNAFAGDCLLRTGS